VNDDSGRIDPALPHTRARSFSTRRRALGVVAMDRRHPSGGSGDAPAPMAVSDSESLGSRGDDAMGPEEADVAPDASLGAGLDAPTKKVVVVNPTFLEQHIGPRGRYQDGRENTRAQLTTLWVLGMPGRPRGEPRELDPPGIATLRAPAKQPKYCSCLPDYCGPCHDGQAGRAGDSYGEGSAFWDEDDDAQTRSDATAAFGARCGARCRPARDFSDEDSSDSSLDFATANMLKESRQGEKPPIAKPVGCFAGCEEEWSEDESGELRPSRSRGKPAGCVAGCLAGCVASGVPEIDPETGRPSRRGCLAGVVDCIDGAKDPKTGRRGKGGCVGACLGEEDPETGRRRPRGGTGCLAGCVADEETGEEGGCAGCLAACLSGPIEVDPKTGERRRRGGCLTGCLYGEEDPETGARRGGCLAACLGDEDDPSDPTRRRRGGCLNRAAACFLGEVTDEGLPVRRSGGCLASCLYGPEDPETGRRRGGCLNGTDECLFGEEDPGPPPRRRGGCLTGCVYGEEDPETGARRGGCLAACLGEEDGEGGKARKGGCLAMCFGEETPPDGYRRGGCLSACLGDEDPETGARTGKGCVAGCLLGCLDVCLGFKNQKTGARRAGCLSACIGDEDDETGRRKGGCLTGCLFGTENRKTGAREGGCLAGCDEDSDWDDDGDGDSDGKKKPRRRRSFLGECFRALCCVPRRDPRRRRRKGRRGGRGGKGGAADSDSEDMSDLDEHETREWARGKWKRKAQGYLDVRAVVLNEHTPPPTVALSLLDDKTPSSATLLALLAAFFAPATWKMLGHCAAPPIGTGVRPPRSARSIDPAKYDRDKESAIVEELTWRTLPWLFERDVEAFGAIFGAAFLRMSLEKALHPDEGGGRKEELFWLVALFPQWLKAARAHAARIRKRRDAIIRMRFRTREGKLKIANAETWDDVTAVFKKETEAEDEAGDKKVDDASAPGWKWPTLTLPDLPQEIEWKKTVNPANDSKPTYDPSIQAALRASVKRHHKKNRGKSAYRGGLKEVPAPDEGTNAEGSTGGLRRGRYWAKPVDDVVKDDDTDPAIGPATSSGLGRRFLRF
jgi:hypothetical protein